MEKRPVTFASVIENKVPLEAADYFLLQAFLIKDFPLETNRPNRSILEIINRLE